MILYWVLAMMHGLVAAAALVGMHNDRMVWQQTVMIFILSVIFGMCWPAVWVIGLICGLIFHIVASKAEG